MDDKLSVKIIVDEECEKLIRQNAIRYNWLATLFFIYSITNLVFIMWRINKNLAGGISGSAAKFYILLYPAISVVHTILSATAVIIYRKATNLQRAAVDIPDPYSFTDSFRMLKKGNIISIVNITIMILMLMFILFQEFKK